MSLAAPTIPAPTVSLPDLYAPIRDDLVAARVAAANQLSSTLQAFWPGAAVIFADIASPIGLAFLRRYPSPSSAKRLTEVQLQRFCKTQHYSGRRSAADLLGRLRAAAAGHVGAQTEKAMAKYSSLRSMCSSKPSAISACRGYGARP